ncbi:hypothetical protein MJ579_02930 [Klebsiella pneumoniae]|nr:hypothetical protein MJ579_02930 [Klebsiella pneumoniae]
MACSAPVCRCAARSIAALIHQANHHPAPVVALNVPSGLNAQTGATQCSEQADHALTLSPSSRAADRQARDDVERLLHLRWGSNAGSPDKALL